MHRFFTLFVGLSISVSLLAQDFEVAPVVLNYSVEAGGIETKSVRVKNHSNKPQTFVINLSDQVRDSLGNKDNLPPGTTARSCADWLTINPSFFDLAPNEAKEVEVTMQVPKDGFDTKWIMMYIKTTQEQSASNIDKVVSSGVIVSPRIGVRIYQSPASNGNYKAHLKKMKEVPSSTPTEREFQVTVQNTGGKVIRPKLYLVLSNLKDATEKKFPPIQKTILPDETQIITLKMPKDQQPGKYVLATIMDYGHNQPLEGIQIPLTLE